MNQPGKRVLLVDDDEMILKAAKTALSRHGYEVLIARDGSEALMRAERDAPDLIVLDVVMPIRSGFSVLDHLHRNRIHSPPVIMMTANEDDRLRDIAASRGIEGFLRKPFKMEELLDRIDSLLNV